MNKIIKFCSFSQGVRRSMRETRGSSFATSVRGKERSCPLVLRGRSARKTRGFLAW